MNDLALSSPRLSTVGRGYLIALVGTAIWSTTAIFIRLLTATYQLPPLVVAFWRDLFASAALALTFAIAAPTLLRCHRRHLRFLLAYGLLLAAFNALWTASVALNGAAVATVLAYSSPAYTTIMAWRLFEERLDAPRLAALALSLIGCVLVSGAYDLAAWQSNLLGIVVGLLGGVAFAGYSLMGKAAARRQINSWTALVYIFALAAGLLLLFNLAAARLPGPWRQPSSELLALGASLPGWGILLVLALGPTIGGYGLYTLSLTYLPASVANLIATLEPSLTAALAYLFLGEVLSGPQLAGSGLIIASLLLLRLGDSAAP